MHITPGEVEQMKYLRGTIVKLVYTNFRDQKPHLDFVPLAGCLERLRVDASLNDVTTALQNMRDRGYVDFEQERNRWTGRITIRRISITPKGCDLVEGNIPADPAVQID